MREHMDAKNVVDLSLVAPSFTAKKYKYIAIKQKSYINFSSFGLLHSGIPRQA